MSVSVCSKKKLFERRCKPSCPVCAVVPVPLLLSVAAAASGVALVWRCVVDGSDAHSLTSFLPGSVTAPEPRRLAPARVSTRGTARSEAAGFGAALILQA